MRVASAKIVDLARALSASSELAKTDTLIEVPPDFLGAVELPDQLKSFSGTQPTGVLRADTHAWSVSLTQQGVNGGGNSFVQALVPGLWRIKGHLSSAFAGTINAASNTIIGMVDGAQAGSFWLAAFPHVPGTYGAEIDQLVSVPSPVPGAVVPGAGAQFVIVTTPTIAGDNQITTVALLVSRIL